MAKVARRTPRVGRGPISNDGPSRAKVRRSPCRPRCSMLASVPGPYGSTPLLSSPPGANIDLPRGSDSPGPRSSGRSCGGPTRRHRRGMKRPAAVETTNGRLRAMLGFGDRSSLRPRAHGLSPSREAHGPSPQAGEMFRAGNRRPGVNPRGTFVVHQAGDRFEGGLDGDRSSETEERPDERRTHARDDGPSGAARPRLSDATRPGGVEPAVALGRHRTGRLVASGRLDVDPSRCPVGGVACRTAPSPGAMAGLPADGHAVERGRVDGRDRRWWRGSTRRVTARRGCSEATGARRPA